MAYEFQDRKNDAIYKGSEVELIVDDQSAIGEVYLDGDLIYQATDMFDEDMLKSSFISEFEVIEAEAENKNQVNYGLEEEEWVGGGDIAEADEYIEDDPGYQPRLYTKGGEYMHDSGKEFIGDYHIHPRLGAMVGKFHTDSIQGSLIPLTVEDIKKLRENGEDPLTVIDYTVDEIGPEEYDDFVG